MYEHMKKSKTSKGRARSYSVNPKLVKGTKGRKLEDKYTINKKLPGQREETRQMMKNNNTSLQIDFSSYSYDDLVELAFELRSDCIKKKEQPIIQRTYDFSDAEFDQVHERLKQLEQTQSDVQVKEGYATRVVKSKKLVYPGIDSCVAVTLVLNTNFKVGVHMVMTEDGTTPFTGPEMISKLQSLINANETVTSAYVDYKEELQWDGNYKSFLNNGYDGTDTVKKFGDAIKNKFTVTTLNTSDTGGNVER